MVNQPGIIKAKTATLNEEHCQSYCTASETNNETNVNADRLNRDCFCKTFDREKFTAILNSDELNQDLLLTHPQLFSNTAVFISPDQLDFMRKLITAVEEVVALPSYRHHVSTQSCVNALYDPGTSGVFMGYDFHVSSEGPKIIEINTNAGGAFLNSTLIKAQTACCAADDSLSFAPGNIDERIIAMFLHEWSLQRKSQRLHRIAIVDKAPQQQFLYPEFKMAQRLFVQHGIETIIAAPEELTYKEGQLFYKNIVIDLVYNRLTDFLLTELSHQHLFDAYHAGAVVLTPSPRHYALYADKRNLTILSDEVALKQLGAKQQQIDILTRGIPKTEKVTAVNAQELWQNRKHLFFKPAAGFGSRAAYRGDKLTKGVWENIQQGQYVAQALIIPSERAVLVGDTEHIALKMDIRAYVYEGDIQLLAARLYQGQTTNFRTEGGGFAPVYITDN
ncbi:MAG TPA: hypothetical protein VIZ65_09990 [Cellvibrionaceae bacterium]